MNIENTETHSEETKKMNKDILFSPVGIDTPLIFNSVHVSSLTITIFKMKRLFPLDALKYTNQ